MTVQGIKEIQVGIKKHKDQTLKNLGRGLLKAGLFLQRESQILVPVEFGVLKASANTRMEGAGRKITVIVSYGTDYAIYVHEKKEARHEVGQAKFLEEPARTKRDRMAEIVRGEMS